jgi:hypothetical protein
MPPTELASRFIWFDRDLGCWTDGDVHRHAELDGMVQLCRDQRR